MKRYHKIGLDDQVIYREFNEYGFYGRKVISESELVKQLLEEVVKFEIQLNKALVDEIVNKIPNLIDREAVQQYIAYFEMVTESMTRLNTKVPIFTNI